VRLRPTLPAFLDVLLEPDPSARHHHVVIILTYQQQLLLERPFNCLFSRTTRVSRYQKGRTSLDFNEAGDDGVLGCTGIRWTIMQTICTSLQTDNHTNTPSNLNFYRLDALRDAQATASKH